MKYYLIGLLLFQPIEEIYNCNHPNTLGDAVHLICVWTDDDFVKGKTGERILKHKRDRDNFIKEHYRRKYWNIRNAPSKK